MPHHVEFDSETGIVCITYAGDITLDMVRQASGDAWDLAKSRGTRCFLSEFQDADIKLTVSDLMQIDKHFESLGISRDIKSAILVPDDTKIAEDSALHEHFGTSRSWQIKTFFNRSEAIEWLLS